MKKVKKSICKLKKMGNITGIKKKPEPKKMKKPKYIYNPKKMIMSYLKNKNMVHAVNE